jgi:hypothetical protein
MNNIKNESAFILLKKHTNLLNLPFIKFIFDNSLYSIIFFNKLYFLTNYNLLTIYVS